MKLSRRNVIKSIGVMAGSTALLGFRNPAPGNLLSPAESAKTSTNYHSTREVNGNVRQSVSYWPFNDIPLDKFCVAAREMGLQSIELLGPDDWPVLKKHGLDCAMPNGAELGLERGFNNPDYHDELVNNYEEMIPKVADAGFKRLICFSGNRDGMDEEEGLEHCVTGLKRIIGTAERYDVTLTMELLNSRVSHPGYQCDHTRWGVDLCERLGSDHFKLLYDIYHMQIMEGDIIRTIRDNHEYISHYHTAGIPGRNEIDDTQELNYPAIVKTIHETGYTGYIGQEFVPSWEDKLASLEQGVQICDI